MTYGKEPFDLRLTVLCMCRRIPFILAGTVLGTLIFGGGYYVKNVLLREAPLYAAESTYRVKYAVEEEKDVGVVYINQMSWNTYLQSQFFLDAVWGHLEESERTEAGADGVDMEKGAGADGTGMETGPGEDGTGMNDAAGADSTGMENAAGAENAGMGNAAGAADIGREALGGMLEAVLASDLRVPSTIVTSDSPEKSVRIAKAVEAAMTQEFAEEIREIISIEVIDSGSTAVEVIPDVRVGRAIALSAVLSGFFMTVITLLQITGEDGVRLPDSIGKRYGVKTVGTLYSRELEENIRYFFRESISLAAGTVPEGKNCVPGRIVVCPVQEQVDGALVLEKLKERCPKLVRTQEEKNKGEACCAVWSAADSPSAHPEVCRELREACGILLALKSGNHGGRQLEHVLEYLRQQDCKVTAVILWEADERLIKRYYAFGAHDGKGNG